MLMQSENVLEELLSASKLQNLIATGDLKQLLADESDVKLDFLHKSICENAWVFDGILDSLKLGTVTLTNSTTYQ